MSDKNIINIDGAEIEAKVSRVAIDSVEVTLNGLLEAAADQRCGTKRFQHSESRKDSLAGHYNRGLEKQAGKVKDVAAMLKAIHAWED